MIDTAEQALNDPNIKQALQAQPHPNDYRNEQGFNLYDFYLWRLKTGKNWWTKSLADEIIRAYERSPHRQEELKEALHR